MSEIINVNNFGGSDTTKIQSAIDAALVNGGTVFIPKGFYTITDTLNVGLQEFDNFAFMVDQTEDVGDSEISTATDPGSESSNNAVNAIDIVFEQGAFLVASISAETPTPVLSYNLGYSEDKTKAGRIINPSIISPEVFVDGDLDNNAIPEDTYASNNLIGIYVGGRVNLVKDALVSGMEYGIAAVNPFWATFSGCRVFHASQGYSFCQANATTISNVLARNCNRGIVFNGTASSVRDIHTQVCNEDLVVLQSDSNQFGPGYMEDSASLTGGSGNYSLTLGYTEDGNNIVHTIFVGIRATAQRTGKKAIRIWATRKCSFIGCRVYGGDVDTDTASNGASLNSDFNIASFPEVLFSPGASFTSSFFAISERQTISSGLKTSDLADYIKLQSTEGSPFQLSINRKNTSGNRWEFQATEQGVAYRPIILNPSGGNIGIGAVTSPSQSLEVEGEVLADGYRLSGLQTAPSSSSDTGTTGEIRVDSNYIYVCTATNTWKRVAIATW